MHVDHVLRPPSTRSISTAWLSSSFFRGPKLVGCLVMPTAYGRFSFRKVTASTAADLGRPQLGERDGSREAQAAAISRHNSFLVVFRHDSATDWRAS